MKRVLKYFLASLIFICSITSAFCRDLTDYDINEYIQSNDLPSAEYNESGYCISGSMVTYYNENPRYDFCFERYTNNGGEDGFIYMCVSSGDYGYQYKYEIYNNANPYAPNAPSFIAYGKSFTASEIEDSDNLLEEFESVIDDPSNVVNRTAHYTFFGDSIITNIPLFNASDTNGINNYVENGDISSAINQNIINPPPEIPYPTNITMSATSKANSGKKYNNPIVVSWDSGYNSEFNYSNMRFNVSYEAVIGKQIGALKSNVSSGVIQVSEHVLYQNERQTYTIGIEKLNKDLQILLGEIADVNLKSAWLESITVYIQNEDSSNSAYKSSIKFVAYDFITGIEDSSNPIEDDGSIGGGESDGESSGTGDGTINNPSSNGSSSGSFTGTIKQEYPKWNLYNNLNNVLTGKNSIIKDYIDNDFALFGSNPLFSVLGTVMPYMPVEYFNLLKLTMSVGCGMAVVGIIFRFLRG